MKIVFLCTTYSTRKDSPYLTDELANALAANGHQVTVLLADWAELHTNEDSQEAPNDNPKVMIAKPVVIKSLPTTIQNTVKWGVSALLMAKQTRRILKTVRPDIVVAFSPLFAMYLPVWFLTNPQIVRRFLVQWDFFPDAQAQIGLVKGKWTIKILRALESYLIRRFNVIGCMSPKNIEYLNTNYLIAPDTQVVHLPLWTSSPPFKQTPRNEVRQRYGIPPEVNVFVFGGQLITGRGISDILAAAKQLDSATDNILFLFIGQGHVSADIAAVVREGNAFVKLMQGISRDEYLTLLTACNVGIVCTLRDVTVPTFPSKTLDYLLAGLPILASVEAATDYGDFIEANNVGVKVLAGDVEGVLKAVRRMAETTRSGFDVANKCKACLDINFSITHAIDIVCNTPFIMI